MLRIDLHLHSCLSPCGALTLSPAAIAKRAVQCGLDVIALTDHNSARNAPALATCARREGLVLLPGLEVTTAEEAHVLCIFDELEAALDMDRWIHAHLPPVEHAPERFGDQPVVDALGNILAFEPYTLWTAVGLTADQVAVGAHERGGLFIPAHVDRPCFSLPAQLGFLPAGPYDAVELSRNGYTPQACQHYAAYPVITSSDAHELNDIGSAMLLIDAPAPTIAHLRQALASRQYRLHIRGDAGT